MARPPTGSFAWSHVSGRVRHVGVAELEMWRSSDAFYAMVPRVLDALGVPREGKEPQTLRLAREAVR